MTATTPSPHPRAGAARVPRAVPGRRVGPRQDRGHRAGPAHPGVDGTQRRLRALMARSWSPEALERAAGIPAPVLREAVERRDSITACLAVAVAGVYDRLWDRNPPGTTVQDRQAGEAARAQAEARGWAPPMAWDDDQIDLPDGKPARGWKPGSRSTWRAADLVNDAEFIRENGGYRDASMAQVAARLGVNRNQLVRAYSRARVYAARGSHAEPEAEAG